MITRTALLRLRTLARISPSSTTAYASSSPLRRTKHAGSYDEESAVYRNSMKFARPSTVTSKPHLRNSVSLIGSVEYPIKQFTKDHQVGAYTILLVKPSPISRRYFRVTLTFWGLLAERALAHLKPNDYIYVSGVLQSYTKSVLEGTERLYYKVKAEELNYVQVPDESYLVAAKPGLQAADLASAAGAKPKALARVPLEPIPPMCSPNPTKLRSMDNTSNETSQGHAQEGATGHNGAALRLRNCSWNQVIKSSIQRGQQILQKVPRLFLLILTAFRAKSSQK